MFVLEQVRAARIGVICQGASSAPHFLLERVQLSTCYPISLSRIHLTASLYLCPADCFFKKLCLERRGILPGTSWRFSNISSEMYALWAHESTSLDINKANGMLASNAKRIFCNNVTCFATNKCCSNRSHLSGCFNCSSLLACKAPKVQFSICFPISLSPIHLTASLYL